MVVSDLSGTNVRFVVDEQPIFNEVDVTIGVLN